VAARADGVIHRVRDVPGDTLLFSSGHFSRMLAMRWLGLEPIAGRLFLLDTASISVLGRENSAAHPAIHLWNDTAHLSESTSET